MDEWSHEDFGWRDEMKIDTRQKNLDRHTIIIVRHERR